MIKNPHTSTWASAADLVLIADALMFLINTHADVSSEAIGLNLRLSIHLHLYVVYATRECSGLFVYILILVCA